VITWARAFGWRQRLKGSLWALPLAGCLLGIGLAQLVLALEGTISLPASWSYSASAASGVLSAIVGAMISLLGLVVTITILVVQQATGTLSPRYMRMWYRDRLQKVVLATFVGTLTYAYSLLRRVDEGSVPVLGMVLAGTAVAVSLVLLLLYVNRFTHALRPVAVAAAVTRAGQEVLETLGAEVVARRPLAGSHVVQDAAPLLTVRSTRHGTIQALAEQRLLEVASRYDCVLVLARGVGDFVPRGTALMSVHGTAAPDGALLEGLVATGTERTIEQDPAFAVRILVDIAIRALSPAVNDPTTAVQVLDYLEELLHSLVVQPLSSTYALCDDRGDVRVVLPGRSWADFLSLAVTEIRLYGATAPQVCRRLRAVLEALLAAAPAEHRAALVDELRRLDAGIDGAFPDPELNAFARESDRQGIGGRTVEPLPREIPQPRAGAAPAG
jgi:uncharacterized membrane protein